MLMIWAVAAGRLRFPSAGHEGITGKPVIVQTTNRLWQPFVARHSDQGVVSMSSLSSLSPDPKSARKRLLVVQPLVGIGDMVWHKPWIDHLAGGFDVILAAKPTAHAKTLFHGTDGIVGWLDIDRSMRGRRGRHDGLAGLLRLAADFRRARADAVLVVHHSATYTLAARLADIPLRWGYGIGGSRRWLNRGAFLGREARHERPYRKLGRYAQANGFGLDRPHWHISTNDGTARAYISNDTSLLNIAAACGRPLGFLRKPSRWTIVAASFRWHCLTAGSARPGRSGGSRRSRLFQS